MFEAKQTVNAGLIDYAQKKVASVRRLHRTSLPIPHVGGTYDPKSLPNILGGILAFESDWSPPLDQALLGTLSTNPKDRLDLECVAAHGIFACDETGCFSVFPKGMCTSLPSIRGRLRSNRNDLPHKDALYIIEHSKFAYILDYKLSAKNLLEDMTAFNTAALD